MESSKEIGFTVSTFVLWVFIGKQIHNNLPIDILLSGAFDFLQYAADNNKAWNLIQKKTSLICFFSDGMCIFRS